MARTGSSLLLIVLLTGLAVAASYLRSGLSAIAEEKQTIATAEYQLRILDDRLSTLAEREAHAQATRDLLQRAESLALSEEHWSKQLTQIVRSEIPRQAALQRIESTNRGGPSIFVPQAYTASVLTPDQSLFWPPPWDKQTINFALSGTRHLLLEEPLP